MWNISAKERFDAFLKTAGQVNEEQLKKLMESVRPGDIVNTHTRLGDVAEIHGIRKAISDGLISKSIAKITGSPETHTALVSSVNPNGTLNLIHNTPFSKVHQMAPKDFLDLVKTTNFSVYRPSGATEAQGMQAATRAVQSAARSTSRYSIPDLGLSLAREAAEKATKAVPAAKSGLAIVDGISAVRRALPGCDPASGYCSHLATHAWGGPLGNAAQKIMGSTPLYTNSSISVTPASIQRAAAAGRLMQVGSYAPKNSANSLLSGIASRVVDKLQTAAPGLTSKARQLAGNIIGAKLP
jgi:hypothetical protein